MCIDQRQEPSRLFDRARCGGRTWLRERRRRRGFRRVRRHVLPGMRCGMLVLSLQRGVMLRFCSVVLESADGLLQVPLDLGGPIPVVPRESREEFVERLVERAVVPCDLRPERRAILPESNHRFFARYQTSMHFLDRGVAGCDPLIMRRSLGQPTGIDPTTEEQAGHEDREHHEPDRKSRSTPSHRGILEPPRVHCEHWVGRLTGRTRSSYLIATQPPRAGHRGRLQMPRYRPAAEPASPPVGRVRPARG